MENPGNIKGILDTTGAMQKTIDAVNSFKGTFYDDLTKALPKTRQITDVIRSTTLKSINLAPSEAFARISRSQRALQEAAESYQRVQRAAWGLATYGPRFLESRLYKELLIYNDLTDKDEESIENKSTDQPEPNSSAIIKLDDINRTVGLIKSIYQDHEEIFRIDSRHFEEMIAELLRKKNYKVELTQQTHDGGRDIIALHDLNGLGVNKYLVECKRYAKNRPVGVDVLRSLCYVVQNEGANKGIIFTSSYFSKGAINMKKEKPFMLDLKGGTDIIDWINDYTKNQSKIITLNNFINKA